MIAMAWLPGFDVIGGRLEHSTLRPATYLASFPICSAPLMRHAARWHAESCAIRPASCVFPAWLCPQPRPPPAENAADTAEELCNAASKSLKPLAVVVDGWLGPVCQIFYGFKYEKEEK
jgi:hypothetical protein